MTSLWTIALLAGLATYLIRLSVIALASRMELPIWLLRVLRFVPMAALTAIIVPEVAYRDGALALGPGNPRLLAALVATLVAWKTRNALWTIGLGMVALWLFSALLG